MKKKRRLNKFKQDIQVQSTIYIEPDGRVQIVNCSKEMVDLAQVLNPTEKRGIIRFKPIQKKKRK